MRRPLAETLIELAEAVVPSGSGGDPLLRITRLSINVPIEIRLEKRGGEWELHADLPQWRWQTGLEELRGRLQLSWGKEAPHERSRPRAADREFHPGAD